MRSNFTLILLFGIALGLTPGAAAQAADPPLDLDLNRMEKFFVDGLDADGAPGGAVAVVTGDRILDSTGFGEADGSGTAVTPDTPFLLGSTTKSFTALAVMQLVEAGKVDLDAPVRD